MRVHFQTLGCRLNEAELESWAGGFRRLGHQVTDQLDRADVVVVNSCAVTEEAVRKSRKLVRRARRNNPDARLVISGCYASLDPERTASALAVDLLVPNEQKHALPELVCEQLQLPTDDIVDEPESGVLSRGRQRAFVKVQDGCRYRCSYCIVTLARGEERSRPIDEVVDEVNRLHAAGLREIVLAGVHLGGYGSDLGCRLSDLIGQLLVRTEMPRIRLGSLEPWELDDAFWALFDNPRLMPHLHLPLQSGADSVLRRMSRRCRTADYAALIDRGRSRVANLNVTSDIIVGFPGETEDEWRQTLAFVEQIGFGHLHIFSYSPREGTKAAVMPDPVPRETARQRSEQLHALAARLKRQAQQRQIGQLVEVLIEGKPEFTASGQRWGGYTPNYLRLSLLDGSGRNLENQILRVRLDGIADDGETLVASPA